MKNALRSALIITAVFAINLWAIPAFPGAEGYGSQTIGGRGGTVYKVTTLTDGTGAGTFRSAISASNRIVVFNVCGVIQISTPLQITASNITIAGETAPAGGITVEGIGATRNGGIWVEWAAARHDIVMRFLRFRGAENGNQGNGFTGSDGRNIVVDHCSFAWACDEVIDLAGGTTDITLQWNYINESSIGCHTTTYHNYAVIHSYDNAARMSLHHCLLAKHTRRFPLLDADNDDIRNNVMYDWQGGGDYAGLYYNAEDSLSLIPYPHDLNVVSNYWKSGPVTGATQNPIGIDAQYRYWITGNVWNKSATTETNVQTQIAKATTWTALTGPVAGTPAITTHTAQQAYDSVLAKAACWPRDSLDKRNTQEVRDRTGTYGRTATDLTAGLPACTVAPADGDNDGMPNTWETARGLNPAAADGNSDDDGDGYTNIEEYLFDCAAAKLASASSAMESPVTADVRAGISFSSNPFQSSVIIKVENQPGISRPVKLRVVNTAGREVFASRMYTQHSLAWNGYDTHGYPLSPGIYFVRVLSAGKILGQEKLVLMR
jgi:hypothetical protein